MEVCDGTGQVQKTFREEENPNLAGFRRVGMSYPSKAPLSQYFLGGEECFDHYPSAEIKKKHYESRVVKEWKALSSLYWGLSLLKWSYRRRRTDSWRHSLASDASDSRAFNRTRIEIKRCGRTKFTYWQKLWAKFRGGKNVYRIPKIFSRKKKFEALNEISTNEINYHSARRYTARVRARWREWICEQWAILTGVDGGEEWSFLYPFNEVSVRGYESNSNGNNGRTASVVISRRWMMTWTRPIHLEGKKVNEVKRVSETTTNRNNKM